MLEKCSESKVRKTIGVLAATLRNFQDWGAGLDNLVYTSKSEISTKNAKFLYLGKKSSVRGTSFGEVILLPGYGENPKSAAIIKAVQPNMGLSS